jgi:diguanylate cyclase (GGDEF)-like protein
MITDLGGTVLVVDDEPSNIEIIAEALADRYELVFATSGEEALEQALSIRPDLILLDVVMPGMSGYDVCAQLKDKRETADIPVIFVTALGDVVAEARGLELGAMDYIAKPINPPVVKVRVRNQIELKRARDYLTRQAVTDGLTGLSNRRHFDDVLQKEYLRLSRSNGLLSLVLFDVDFFKPFNDTYGHLAGDDCLRGIGGSILNVLSRPADIAARYGGEEFVCILPDTDHVGALKIAEDMRHAIAALAIPHAKSTAAPHVTASMGVVTVPCSPGRSPLHLVALADEQLYAAKAGGRNRVCGICPE